MKRTFLKSLLSAAMLMTAVGASAYDFKDDNGYRYTIKDNAVAITYEERSNGGYTGDVVIPESVTYNDVTYPVTEIDVRAFYDCEELTSVTIPSTVTTIGNYAFYKCKSLTTITIPESVTSTGTYLLAECSNLESVVFPSTVTVISNYTFNQCSSLKSFVVSDAVTRIGNYAFRECAALESLTIGKNVEELGSNALFACTKLTSVHLPAAVSKIGTNAFGMNDLLTEITVDEANATYTSIDGVVYDKEVTKVVACPGAKASVTIPETVTEIPQYAFRECGELTSIVIPDGVTSIGMYAFRECLKLTTVTLGSGLTTMAANVFNGCTAITSITCLGATPAEGKANSFADETYANATLTVPAGAKEAYQAGTPWSSFTNIVEAEATGISNVISDNGEEIKVYDMSGKQVSCGNMSSNKIYVVKKAGKTFKVIGK